MKLWKYTWNYEKIISGYLVIHNIRRIASIYKGNTPGIKIAISVFCLLLCIIAAGSILEGVINILFHIMCVLTKTEVDNIIMTTWLDWITPSGIGSKTNLSNQEYLNVRSVMSAINTYNRSNKR